MISWRYHLVSIVAVILAVALGVLAGATVVGDRFVDQLRRQTDSAQQRADAFEAEAARLREFTTEAVQYLTAGKLVDESGLGTEVVLVTQEPVDGMRDQVLQALEDAGANVVAQLTATTQLTDSDALGDLAALVDRPGLEPSALPAALAAKLGARLKGLSTQADGTDLLEELDPFVVVDPARDVDLRDVGGPSTVVVVFASATVDPELDPQSFLDPRSFLVPFTGELAKAPTVAVAAGEGVSSELGFVAAVRDDGEAFPDGVIVTVDDLDEPIGRAALVLGLANLLASPGDGGDYGENGNGFLPPPPASEPAP
ncbi:MAG TPA: copper transporter [Actinomycetota bacterium]|nr:copper transporter [Actinomycetota bacterium]